MLRKNVKSFEQWCIENNKQRYLDLWDYDKNNCLPSDVAASNSINKFYFKCESGVHDSFLKGINNLINSKDLVCPQCNSFYAWCIDNKRTYLIDAWDNNRNDDIHFVQKGSGNKYWFNINDVCSYKLSPSEITSPIKNADPFTKYYNSFGFYLISHFGDNGINLYWSDQNMKSPYDYDYGSAKSVKIKCINKSYHDDYDISCYSFTGKSQCRCPMCASKIIHPKDSFAQFNIDKYGNDWIDKYWCDDNTIDPYKISVYNNDIKVHIKCQNVDYHDFYITPANYSLRDKPCPYCKRKILHKYDQFGYKHKELMPLWQDKNTVDPYSIPEFYHNKVWFKCENGIHEDYQRQPSDCFRSQRFHFRCTQCASEDTVSSFQKMVNEYFKNTPYTILHEYKCNIIPINPKTNYPLPLDNEVVDLQLIIEVHGKQHYEIDGFSIMAAKHNGTTPEEELKYTMWKDEYKKNYVISQGYHYLSIPYYAFDSDDYIHLIENKINEIKQNNQNP